MALAYGHCVTFLKSSDFLCLSNWSLVWNTFKYYPSSKFGKLQSYWLGVLPLFQSQVILKWWVINPCKTIPECYGVSRTIFTLNLVHNGLNYIELFRFQKPTDLKTIAPSVLTTLVFIVDDLLFKFSEDTAVLVDKELLQILKAAWSYDKSVISACNLQSCWRCPYHEHKVWWHWVTSYCVVTVCQLVSRQSDPHRRLPVDHVRHHTWKRRNELSIFLV